MSDRFDELWSRYLEGELKDSDREELDRILAEDPKLAERAMDFYAEHRLLGRDVQGDDAERFVKAVGSTIREDDEIFVRKVSDGVAGVPRPYPITRVIGYAAVAMITFAATFLWRSGDPEVAPGAHVATLVRAENCRWDSPNAEEGSRLAPSRLRLVSGTAVIGFDDGASLALTGPAELSLDGRDEATLHAGRAIVRAPEEAAGFALRTPHREFIDWGTEFTVAVDPSGATELHVHEGLVESMIDSDGPSRFVKEGEALRFAPDTDTPRPVSLSEVRFDSILEEASSPRTSGRLFVYDPFDYEITDAPRAQGGTGWNGPWYRSSFGSPERLTLAPAKSLIGPASLAPGIGGAVHLGGPGGKVYKRQLATPLDFDSNAVVYFSFLVSPGETNDGSPGWFAVVWTSRRHSRTRAWIGLQPDDRPRLFIRGGGVTPGREPIRPNTTYLVVGKIVTSKTHPDRMYAKLFAPDETLDPREPTSWDMTGRPTRLSVSLDEIHLAFEATENGRLDELRIGDTWEKVVPLK